MQKWKCSRESVTLIDKDCAEDAHACVTAPDRASLYTNALT